ncbi:helix-turn-helix transcriptional regulator [Amycolatopsis sp. YIM 10]|uniref:helix-turn-helix transcriptional regulator n=1 Tax=Amycolatopsis sp. YIM 10 TaxID=2653857 RepID=UPI00128FD36E|nr:helix-turn-helix transcriptional regulator [Amycolatopsis sp. YIM 10]QFU86316.1 Helix-turn-helix protein [Amycolatopsis sp. YIM 10]
MATTNPLGQFLRARRAQARPEDSGLAPGPRRRVSGLRREEVALLAGVSTDYYIRLEQGRERNPSPQVLDALAQALDLDEELAEHLHRVARPLPARRAAGDRVSENLLRSMAAWPDTPAVVLGPYLNVLAHNALGGALFAGHRYSDDLVRLVFLDPDGRTFYPDWDRVAVNTVAGLRAAAIDHDDPRLIEVVGELSVKSAEFRKLWARHDIRQKTRETKRFQHPLVGPLTLHYESLTVNSAPGQQLVIYQADADSPTAEALQLLGSLVASDE